MVFFYSTHFVARKEFDTDTAARIRSTSYQYALSDLEK